MTISQAIAGADRLQYNTFSAEQKTQWLQTLEQLLERNILKTHAPGEEEPRQEGELLAAAPFDSMYISWLLSRMDLHNGELERYNASIVVFNAEYAAFESWYNRTHMPLNRGSWHYGRGM